MVKVFGGECTPANTDWFVRVYHDENDGTWGVDVYDGCERDDSLCRGHLESRLEAVSYAEGVVHTLVAVKLTVGLSITEAETQPLDEKKTFRCPECGSEEVYRDIGDEAQPWNCGDCGHEGKKENFWPKPGIFVTSASVTLYDENGEELLHWVDDEWKEDPSVVESMLTATKILYEKGPEEIRKHVSPDNKEVTIC